MQPLATATADSVRGAIQQELASLREELVAMSHAIHGYAELAFQERQSAALLAECMQRHGFMVQRQAAQTDTAFIAHTGGAGPAVAFVCEYDALPEMGHACGHNLIAAASAGAGLALAAALRTHAIGGRVMVIGAPAEESGGGKIGLVDAGVFDSVDAALMLHPSDRTNVTMHALACTHWDWAFTGRAAHASSDPQRGLNALDAFVHAYMGISLWRQQLPDGARVHGVIRDGGAAPNVIPEHTAGEFISRARTWTQLEEMNTRFAEIWHAAAAATGCTLALTRDAGYRDLRFNSALADVCRQRLAEVGLAPEDATPWERAASTDAGNMSYAVPTIHPEVAIAEPGVRYHTAAFEAAADTPRAYDVILRGAEALALTAFDVCTDSALREEVRAEFRVLPERRVEWQGSGV